MAMKIPSQKSTLAGIEFLNATYRCLFCLHSLLHPVMPINYYTTIRWVSGEGPIFHKLQEILDPPDGMDLLMLGPPHNLNATVFYLRLLLVLITICHDLASEPVPWCS